MSIYSEDKIKLDDLINRLELVYSCGAPCYGSLPIPKEHIKEIIDTLNDCKIKLNAIEKIAETAFKNPDTKSVDLYRLQALANIYSIFLYGNESPAIKNYLNKEE